MDLCYLGLGDGCFHWLTLEIKLNKLRQSNAGGFCQHLVAEAFGLLKTNVFAVPQF